MYRASDPTAVNFHITHPGEPCALAWVNIEPSPAGGYNLWYSDDGREHPFPHWRPDLPAAQDAAFSLADHLARHAAHETGGRFHIQISGAEDLVLEEVPFDTSDA